MTDCGMPKNQGSCNPSIHVDADIFLWTARESGTDCWAEGFSKTSTSTTNTLEAIDFGWDPGFRVGIGCNTGHDSWDTQLYFTCFHTSANDSVSGAPGSVHSTFVGAFYLANPSGLSISGPAYEKARIKWKIDFNTFDLELGRKFFVSDALTFRPFVGVKGGWIDQSIHSLWQNPTIIFEFFNTSVEDLSNNFWGIGPSGGINGSWKLSSHFNLIGDFSTALMYGHWSFSDLFYNKGFDQKITSHLKDIDGGAMMVRTWLGLEWIHSFLSLKLGYEMQVWFDQLQYYSFVGGRLDNALTLQGGTLELSICY